MPMYTYEVVKKDGSAGEVFDVLRTMSDPPLTHHPETGEKVKRIFQPIHIAGAMHESHSKNRLSDKNLAKQGFTKYQRNGKGHYERTAGKQGPETISVD